MRRRGWPLLATLASVAIFAPALSCREPTQAIIAISTLLRCDELTQVDITVASTTPRAKADFEYGNVAATSVGCHNGNIGELLVTPGSDSGAVQVVVGAKAPLTAIYGSKLQLAKACAEHPEFCIVARRKFFFLPATTISIPVALEADCRGVVCEALSTCQRGGCVDALVQCAGTECTIPVDAPADAAARLDDGSTGSHGDGSATDSGSDGGRNGNDSGGSDGGAGNDGALPPLDGSSGEHNNSCGGGPAHCGVSCDGIKFCCRVIMSPSSARCAAAGTPCVGPNEVPSCCDGSCGGDLFCGRPNSPGAPYVCTATRDVTYDYICQSQPDCPAGSTCGLDVNPIHQCTFGVMPH